MGVHGIEFGYQILSSCNAAATATFEITWKVKFKQNLNIRARMVAKLSY